MTHIYLDHNSTTPIDPRVADEIDATHRQGFGNPASQHQVGQQARRALETAKEEIGEILGARFTDIHSDRMIITSGGTESNNLALLGITLADSPGTDGNIIVPEIEHPSVIGAAGHLKRIGIGLRKLPVDSQGVVVVDALDDLIDEKTRMVSLMLANNETGVIQPVSQAAAICRERGVKLHTDAVQAVGKIKVDFAELGVDALSLSAHKFHGPRGVGGLILRHDCTIDPIFHGGFQQQGIRPGTEDVALTRGLSRALQIWNEESELRVRHLGNLRDRLESQLTAAIPTAIVNGSAATRLPHTCNISFPGLNRQAILLAADMEGIAVSTGSACASGSSEPSPVLLAMGSDPEVTEGSIRLSVGMTNTLAEVDLAGEKLVNIIRALDGQK